MTTAVAAAASVPSSFTSTNALWTTAEMDAARRRRRHPGEVGACGSNARVMPSALQLVAAARTASRS